MFQMRSPNAEPGGLWASPGHPLPLTLLRKIVLRDQRDFLEASREFIVCLF